MKRERCGKIYDREVEADLDAMMEVRQGKRTRLSQISTMTKDATLSPSMTSKITAANLKNYGCDAEVKTLYTHGPQVYMVVGEPQAIAITLLFNWILDLSSVKWSPDKTELNFQISPCPELKEQDPDLHKIDVSVESASFAYGNAPSPINLYIMSLINIPSVKFQKADDVVYRAQSWDGLLLSPSIYLSLILTLTLSPIFG